MMNRRRFLKGAAAVPAVAGGVLGLKASHVILDDPRNEMRAMLMPPPFKAPAPELMQLLDQQREYMEGWVTVTVYGKQMKLPVYR